MRGACTSGCEADASGWWALHIWMLHNPVRRLMQSPIRRTASFKQLDIDSSTLGAELCTSGEMKTHVTILCDLSTASALEC